MFFMTISVFCFTFLQILIEIQSANEEPDVDNEVAGTEWSILNTMNNLFSTLKLKDIDQKLKLKQHSTIHNFFTSMTLQDHDNLKEIARLTKVDSLDNSTQVFITQLNEVLNEDYKSDEETDANYVTNLIGEFLENLDYLKVVYGLKNNYTKLNINKDVIKHLDDGDNEFENETIFENGNNSHENLLSENEYWQPSGRRIYLGQRVKIERYPFIASVQFFKKFQCAGSIIKSDLVITSASCLQLAWNNRFFRENPAFLSVRVGSSYYEGGGDDISVLEIYFHPNYNPKNLRHNLAIMRLLRKLKFGAKFRQIKKIEIDRNPTPLPVNTDGITIVGWGAKSPRNIIGSPRKNKLSYAVLDFYPLSECQEVYSKEYVSATNFCAGFFSKGGGACNRDAGAPGVSHGILIGVVSFGSPICGAPDAPTVFTKVGFYADWIEEIMMQEVPSQYVMTTNRPTTYYTEPHMSESTTFKMKPIDSDDVVRMHDKAHSLEEFIATLFDSKEIKRFVDEMKARKQKMRMKLEKKVREQLQSLAKKKYNTITTTATENKSIDKIIIMSKGKTKVILKVKDKIKALTKVKSKGTTKNTSIIKSTTTKTSSHKHVSDNHLRKTTNMKFASFMKNFGSSSVTSLKRVTAAYKHRNITEQNDSSDYDRRIENALESLIDDSDLDEFLDYDLSSSDILRKPKSHNTGKSNKRHKGQKTNKIDELYSYLFEIAKDEINNENYNNNGNIDSSGESENTQEEEDNKSNDSGRYETQYESGVDDKDITKENENADENETEIYETGHGGANDNSTENDENTEDLQLFREDSSKSHKKRHKNADKPSKDDQGTSNIIIKSKISKAKRNQTEKLLRILAKSHDFYQLVAKAVEKKLQ